LQGVSVDAPPINYNNPSPQRRGNQTPTGDKTMNIELLNTVKNGLITFANKEGIVLADHFATVAKFQEFVIAFTIRSIVELDLGIDAADAYDLVFGDGSFRKLADDIWNQLQKS
jgi:hypothetical protein